MLKKLGQQRDTLTARDSFSKTLTACVHRSVYTKPSRFKDLLGSARPGKTMQGKTNRKKALAKEAMTPSCAPQLPTIGRDSTQFSRKWLGIFCSPRVSAAATFAIRPNVVVTIDMQPSAHGAQAASKRCGKQSLPKLSRTGTDMSATFHAHPITNFLPSCLPGTIF